jgi:hypothetical protein
MEGAAGHPVEVTAEWAWPRGGVDLNLRGWKNHPTSATMATAGMTITRNATMLSAMPKTREGECCKHGCHHNDRDRSDDPGTPSGDDNGLPSQSRSWDDLRLPSSPPIRIVSLLLSWTNTSD